MLVPLSPGPCESALSTPLTGRETESPEVRVLPRPHSSTAGSPLVPSTADGVSGSSGRTQRPGIFQEASPRGATGPGGSARVQTQPPGSASPLPAPLSPRPVAPESDTRDLQAPGQTTAGGHARTSWPGEGALGAFPTPGTAIPGNSDGPGHTCGLFILGNERVASCGGLGTRCGFKGSKGLGGLVCVCRGGGQGS